MEKPATPNKEADFSQSPPTKTSETDTNVEEEARKLGTTPGEWANKEGA